MSDGTALPRFKRAFVQTLVAAGVPNVAYQSPMDPEEVFGADGSGASCWFGDGAQGNLDIKLLGGPDLWIDETWIIPFVVQVLGRDTDDDQEAVDQRACELLGAVMGSFADPSFGITDDTIQTFAAVPVGAQPWAGGVTGQGLRAARFELSIELMARLQIS